MCSQGLPMCAVGSGSYVCSFLPKMQQACTSVALLSSVFLLCCCCRSSSDLASSSSSGCVFCFFTSKVCLFVRQCASVFSEPYLVSHHQIWFFFRRCVLLLCFLSYLSSSLESLLSVLVLILCYFSDSLFIR